MTEVNGENTPFGSLFGEEPAELPAEGLTKSKDLYFDLVRCYHDMCMKLASEPEVDGNEIVPKVNDAVAILRKDDRMLMGLANSPYTYVNHQVGNLVYADIVIHGVNVLIYSLKIFLDLSVPENRLPYLGVAALLSRVGLLEAPEEDLVQTRNRTQMAMKISEFEDQSRKFLAKLKIDDFHTESIETIISLVKEEQQSLSRTSLTEAVHQYAMVIHICEVFEKLTHQKTYGEIFAPVDAMKKMRNEMKDFFNQDIIKFFFNKLSIYPLGSFVKLSSGETAKIVSINENFIMRPVVTVVLDNQGREKVPPVRMNLREKPTVYIKKPIVDEYLTEQFVMVF